MKTYKALGALLEYPTEDMVAALPEILAVIETERLLPVSDAEALEQLIDQLACEDIYDLQEDYVNTFDRGRATCLNLFEHVHGESRDRGQAMVDLKQVYENAGFFLTANQLPDYLPAMLEYLSLRNEEEASEMLADCSHILLAIGAGLARRSSPYCSVLRALLRLAGEKRPEQLIRDTQVEDDSTPEAIDRAWAEDPVTFMGSCAPQQPQTSVIQFHKGAAS